MKLSTSTPAEIGGLGSNMVDKSKAELWKDKGLTLRDRLGKPPAVRRDGVDEEQLNKSMVRGDLSQHLRLKFYPSIEVEFDKLYAGSYDGTLVELEHKLFEMGYRNNPTAYVEVTEQFGPDDGSYCRQRVVEDDEFPYLGIGRPFGLVTWWNRLKVQVHAATFVDEARDLVHILAHWEASAWLQPIRHVTVSKADGVVGTREFRERWFDEFDEQLPQPLDVR